MYLPKSSDTLCVVASNDAVRIIRPMSAAWYERAKLRMRTLRLTQDDLCRPLGVKTRGAVGHYLTGRREPGPEQLKAIAQILKMSLDDLLGETSSFPALEQSPPQYITIDEDLLAKCLQFVEKTLNQLSYPAGHHIRNDRNRASLVANTYSRAIKAKGHITRDLEGELREKIKLAARMTVRS